MRRSGYKQARCASCGMTCATCLRRGCQPPAPRKHPRNDLRTDLLAKIAERAFKLYCHVHNHDENHSQADLWKSGLRTMIAVCDQSCELDYDVLLAFDDFNFAHDVFGIQRHLSPRTMTLDNHFLPRCAQAQHTRRA